MPKKAQPTNYTKPAIREIRVIRGCLVKILYPLINQF
jgi:hypothetical protein